jgi:methylmalonyl-CoA/ethylmalonyl-CoA epimerase
VMKMSSQREGKIVLGTPMQVCAVVANLEEAMRYYSSKFDIAPWQTFTLPSIEAQLDGKPATYELKVALSWFGSVRFELIEPKGETIHKRFLEEHGEGLHHLAFEVADLDSAIANWEKHGITCLQRARSVTGALYAYMGSEGMRGVTIELIQLPKDYETRLKQLQK